MIGDLSRRSLMAAAGLLLVVVGLLAASTAWRPAAPVVAAPNAFYGPVHGGCYLATEVSCAVHIDGWQPIVVNPGRRLVGFRLDLQNVVTGKMSMLYDFRTDVSNPPGDYVPSVVRGDYAAACGETYAVMLSVRDSGDQDYGLTGMTNAFACPAAPTPTPTATPEPTATAQPTATTPFVPARYIFAPVVFGE